MVSYWTTIIIVLIGFMDIYHGLPSNQQEHDLFLLDALSRRNAEGYYGNSNEDPVMEMLGRSKDYSIGKKKACGLWLNGSVGNRLV